MATSKARVVDTQKKKVTTGSGQKTDFAVQRARAINAPTLARAMSRQPEIGTGEPEAVYDTSSVSGALEYLDYMLDTVNGTVGNLEDTLKPFLDVNFGAKEDSSEDAEKQSSPVHRQSETLRKIENLGTRVSYLNKRIQYLRNQVVD